MQNEIINAEDYLVKYPQGIIENGYFKGYKMVVHPCIIRQRSNKGLRVTLSNVKDGELIEIKFTIDEIREIAQQDLINASIDAIVDETSKVLENVAKKAQKDGFVPKEIPNLNYLYLVPRDMLKNDEYVKEIADRVSDNMVDYGKDKSPEQQNLIAEASANFTNYELPNYVKEIKENNLTNKNKSLND